MQLKVAGLNDFRQTLPDNTILSQIDQYSFAKATSYSQQTYLLLLWGCIRILLCYCCTLAAICAWVFLLIHGNLIVNDWPMTVQHSKICGYNFSSLFSIAACTRLISILTMYACLWETSCRMQLVTLTDCCYSILDLKVDWIGII